MDRAEFRRMHDPEFPTEIQPNIFEIVNEHIDRFNAAIKPAQEAGWDIPGGYFAGNASIGFYRSTGRNIDMNEAIEVLKLDDETNPVNLGISFARNEETRRIGLAYSGPIDENFRQFAMKVTAWGNILLDRETAPNRFAQFMRKLGLSRR